MNEAKRKKLFTLIITNVPVVHFLSNVTKSTATHQRPNIECQKFIRMRLFSLLSLMMKIQ